MDLEMDIPDEECDVPLNHTFLGDNATEKMREGRSYSGNTIVKYIFLDQEEKKPEKDPSHLQLLQPQVQQSFNQIQNPIFQEEENA